MSLFDGLPDLDHHASVKSVRFKQRPQVTRKKITPDRTHCFIDPTILVRVVRPKVLVSIDPHMPMVKTPLRTRKKSGPVSEPRTKCSSKSRDGF
jgi:hypothetical protein